MVSFKINGKDVQGETGEYLLQVAQRNGIAIPTLCHHKMLEPAGMCRLCLVELFDGRRTRLVTSCNYPVWEGMQIQTDTEALRHIRTLIVELLLSRCPHSPFVKELAQTYGIAEPRFTAGDDDCILCGLCTRICERIGKSAIGLSGRGIEIKVDTPYQMQAEDCITCGACVSICPTGHIKLADISKHDFRPIPSEYDVGLSGRKPIYIPYAQAVPKTPAIDRSVCAHFKTDGCRICAQVCPAGAIDHAQQDETIELDVGSVILATGLQPFDPSHTDRYLYGRHPNVMTNLEFERMLSPSGPFQGHIRRRSDGKDPKKIAWVQCVGSRSHRDGANPYCSTVCCMAALKQTIIAKEHLGNGLDTAVFLMDMRTHRKDFEKYYERAKKQGGRLIRSRVHTIDPVEATGDLTIRYVLENGKTRQENFDMVVLSIGLTIPPSTVELAQRLGVQLGPNRFLDADCLSPVATSRPGVYACGVLTGPKDIPQTVAEASAAASAATGALALARGTLQKKKVFPPESNVDSEEVRVGVFVCNCGINIGGVADVPAIVDYAKTLRDVAYAKDHLFSCSQDSQMDIIAQIKEHNLNRVVVASCSPSTHQAIFQEMLRNAGLNKYLFEMANIRNHCTWCHQQEPQKATQKCKDLVNMAVAKARLLKPLEYLSANVTNKALVVGGGVSGMVSALAIADQGFAVDLIEQKDALGGQALKLDKTWKGEPIRPFVEEVIRKVQSNQKITLHLGSTVAEASGFAGNFVSKLSNGQQIEHGVAVLATGAKAFQPEGLYLFGKNPNVLHLLDMDSEIARKTERNQKAKAVAFIQCVGSRIPERPYCNKICCSHSVENALKLKAIDPEMDVYIIYRDMRTYGERESLYAAAREKGVIFIRYTLDHLPQVEDLAGRLKITVKDHILQKPVAIIADVLALATAVVPNDNSALSQTYKVALNAEGFFSEVHAKIRPLDSATDGIFMAGMCHFPKPIEESIAEGYAAASRATTILSKEFLQLESTISHPVDENCDGCAFCIEPCPYQAISLLEYMKGGEVKKTVEVNEVRCKGCGSCMATCPKQGIVVKGFTMEQLGAQVEAALGLI
ncbi:MAG: 4Fe-4S dicluster domain-containing protein [Desulfobacteraceae bacterium]|nr:MAG: 4Fe-4S dicluster domain-containing protein [Desulfobacteraceae bacterium]